MHPALAAAVLVALVAAATVLGLVWRRRWGRARRVDGVVLTAAELPAPLGVEATVVQFSSDWCAPCEQAHRTVDGVRADRPGVAHISLDVAEHPELVQRFSVQQLPTLLVLDAAGAVRSRIGGAPTRATLLGALDDIGAHEGRGATRPPASAVPDARVA